MKLPHVAALYVQTGGKDSTHRIGTPPEFRDLLIAMARSVKAEAMA